MSYRLRKLWDKNPKAAAKETCFHVIVIVLIVLFVLSDGCKMFPPFWQILIVVVIAGALIWGILYFAKVLQEWKDEGKVSDDEKRVN